MSDDNETQAAAAGADRAWRLRNGGVVRIETGVAGGAGCGLHVRIRNDRRQVLVELWLTPEQVFAFVTGSLLHVEAVEVAEVVPPEVSGGRSWPGPAGDLAPRARGC